MTERSFVAVKPDAVQRGLVGAIISRFEQKGLKLVGLKLLQVPESMAAEHYKEHQGKPFYGGLIDFITSGPIVAMAWQAPNAVALCRSVIGATKPEAAAPGTLRFDYGLMQERNIVHGSDSPANAERELAIFFKPEELLGDWRRNIDSWLVV
jgi:nucleoside-diphosphate kinase